LATGVHAGSVPNQVKEQYCYAIVQDNKAAFIFPIINNENWTWLNKETKDNELEYSWEVLLLGVYLFKYP
jgi:hypothetical protein